MAFRIGNRVTLRKPVNDWFNQLAPDSAAFERVTDISCLEVLLKRAPIRKLEPAK
jgi:hypothetical protein